MGHEIPKRVQYLRVIIMELARIADHIICSSVMGVDTGALTGFLYVMQYREKIYEIYEEICGARLTTNMGRIGGFEREWSDVAWKKIHEFLDGPPHLVFLTSPVPNSSSLSAFYQFLFFRCSCSLFFRLVTTWSQIISLP